MRPNTFFAAVVAIVAVVPACSDTPPSRSSGSGGRASSSAPPVEGSTEEWIAYQEEIAGLAQIFLVRPDGSGRRQLASGVARGHQTNPDWSPDGQRLVFAAGNGATDDLWVIDADGSDAQLLLECVDPCVALDDPAWSRDGRSILFSRLAIAPSGDVAAGTLELVDLESGVVSVLLTAPEPDFLAGPRFSPDGRTVVVEWVHTDGSAPFEQVTGVELAVVDLDAPTPTMRPITDAPLFAATADWSPDGSTIVYSALATPDGADPELFTIRHDGAGLTRLTSVVVGGGSAEHPDYSADGARVLFAGSLDGGRPELMAVDVTTGTTGPAVGTKSVQGTHPRSRLLG